MSDRDLPEGVINADPPGGWEGVNDGESAERNEEAIGSADLVEADEPIESDEPTQAADPDLGVEQ
jgi:hypothetical protein